MRTIAILNGRKMLRRLLSALAITSLLYPPIGLAGTIAGVLVSEAGISDPGIINAVDTAYDLTTTAAQGKNAGPSVAEPFVYAIEGAGGVYCLSYEAVLSRAIEASIRQSTKQGWDEAKTARVVNTLQQLKLAFDVVCLDHLVPDSNTTGDGGTGELTDGDDDDTGSDSPAGSSYPSGWSADDKICAQKCGPLFDAYVTATYAAKRLIEAAKKAERNAERLNKSAKDAEQRASDMEALANQPMPAGINSGTAAGRQHLQHALEIAKARSKLNTVKSTAMRLRASADAAAKFARDLFNDAVAKTAESEARWQAFLVCRENCYRMSVTLGQNPAVNFLKDPEIRPVPGDPNGPRHADDLRKLFASDRKVEGRAISGSDVPGFRRVADDGACATSMPDTLVFGAVVVDLNTDGTRDVVLLNPEDQSVSVLLPVQDGPVADQQTFWLPEASMGVSVFDADGDCVNDIVTYGDRGVVDPRLILPGLGDGQFGEPIDFEANALNDDASDRFIPTLRQIDPAPVNRIDVTPFEAPTL